MDTKCLALPSANNWLGISELFGPVLIPRESSSAVWPHKLADSPWLIAIYKVQSWKIISKFSDFDIEKNTFLFIV